MKSLHEPLTPKKAALYVAVLAGIALLSWGGWQLFGKFTGRPPSTAEVKRSLWHYLKKETGTSEFSTEFASATVSNAVEELSITNKNGKVKKIGRRKRGELGLPETSLTAYFRTNQAAAGSYREMYLLIGQQLAVADRLLESEDVPQKQSALVMASEASTYARNNAMNLSLAARICEGYLWPNLSLVEGTNKAPFTPDALLNICDMAFKEAGETDHVIRNYEYFIARTTRPQQADTARFRLARLYLDTGEESKALATLKQIKTVKNARVEQQIAALEQKLKQRK
jgi:hypothetical protein